MEEAVEEETVENKKRKGGVGDDVVYFTTASPCYVRVKTIDEWNIGKDLEGGCLVTDIVPSLAWRRKKNL
jgi:hypothetical protein